jgi:uncharacterized membrane protein
MGLFLFVFGVMRLVLPVFFLIVFQAVLSTCKHLLSVFLEKNQTTPFLRFLVAPVGLIFDPTTNGS